MWLLDSIKETGPVIRGMRKITMWIAMERDFQNVFFFFPKILDERLLIFENVTWVHRDCSLNVELIRIYKTAFDLKVKTTTKTISVFGFLQRLVIVFEMRFSTCQNLFIKCSFNFGGNETPFSFEFAEERNFQKVCWFSETWNYCLIVFKHGFCARLEVCFNCSLEFTHWNYFPLDPQNIVSLMLLV